MLRLSQGVPPHVIFFGFMDLDTMAYRAPVFLVPSKVVHSEAVHRTAGGLVHFNFIASMDPTSKDRWRPYACDPAEVAARIVKFLQAQTIRRRSAALPGLSPTIWQPGTILVARAA